MAAETALLEVGATFAAIGAVGFPAGRLDLSPIPFYVLAGIALNESVLGAVGTREERAELAALSRDRRRFGITSDNRGERVSGPVTH